MTKHILILALFLTVFFSCFEIIAIAYQGQKIKEFEQEFISMNKSVICRALKGIGTGKILRSCRGCVTDSAEILSEIIQDNNV